MATITTKLAAILRPFRGTKPASTNPVLGKRRDPKRKAFYDAMYEAAAKLKRETTPPSSTQ